MAFSIVGFPCDFMVVTGGFLRSIKIGSIKNLHLIFCITTSVTCF